MEEEEAAEQPAAVEENLDDPISDPDDDGDEVSADCIGCGSEMLDLATAGMSEPQQQQ